MPTALCDNGHVQHWSHYRGSCLADLRCRECGSGLHRARRNEDSGEWELAPTPARGQGAKRCKCFLCGAMRLVPGRGIRLEQEEVLHSVGPKSGGSYADPKELRLPAGTVICAYHLSPGRRDQIWY